MLIEDEERAATDPAHRAVNHCPAWCREGEETHPDGAIMHYGPPATVALPGRYPGMVDALVYAEYYDWPPGDHPNVPDHERDPTVTISVPDFGDIHLSPEQAHAFGTAITTTAELIQAHPMRRRT